MSPTIGTSTPRTGDSAIEAHMIGEYGPFSLLLPMQDFGLWTPKVSSYDFSDFSGDDLIRLKKGEPLRCGLIHLLSGTSKLVSRVLLFLEIEQKEEITSTECLSKLKLFQKTSTTFKNYQRLSKTTKVLF